MKESIEFRPVYVHFEFPPLFTLEVARLSGVPKEEVVQLLETTDREVNYPHLRAIASIPEGAYRFYFFTFDEGEREQLPFYYYIGGQWGERMSKKKMLTYPEPLACRSSLKQALEAADTYAHVYAFRYSLWMWHDYYASITGYCSEDFCVPLMDAYEYFSVLDLEASLGIETYRLEGVPYDTLLSKPPFLTYNTAIVIDF